MVWPEARGHKTYAEYRDIFSSRGQDIHENFLFSIVRNPFSWHVSWYRYIQGDPGGLHSGHKIESKLFKKMKFSDYVEWLQDPDAPRSPQGYIQRQIHEWLTDERGVIRVDCVLRQERLELDFQDLIRRTGILVSVGGDRENVSNFGEWRNYYTSQEVDVIARKHADDLRIFNYSFE